MEKAKTGMFKLFMSKMKDKLAKKDESIVEALDLTAKRKQDSRKTPEAGQRSIDLELTVSAELLDGLRSGHSFTFTLFLGDDVLTSWVWPANKSCR